MFEWIYTKLFPQKNNEENQEQQRMSFKLTPLDPFSVSFINIDNLNFDVSILNAAIPTIKSEIKQLQSKLDSLNKNQPKYLKSALSEIISKQSSNNNKTKAFISNETRDNAIIIHLYNKNLDKLKKRQIKLHEESIYYCNQMIEFIQNIIDQRYPIKIDYNGFIKKINDYISPTKNQEIVKINNLSKCLNKMSSSPQNSLFSSESQNIQIPTAKQVFQTLKSQLSLFDKKSRYMREGIFDTVFELYISNDQMIMSRYNEILNEMSLFEYSKALEDLFEMTKLISGTFGLSYTDYIDKGGSNNKISQNEIFEFLIVFYSSTRFFFNQVTIHLPYLLTNDLASSNFIKNCTLIQTMTPRELKAVNNVFLPHQLDKTVKEIFTEDKELKKSLAYFQLITFYNSPLDIAFFGNKAINIFNKMIYINFYLNKKCNGDPNGKVPGIKYPSNPDSESDLLSDSENDGSDFNCDIAIAFDDLFTVFYMAMAMQPPPNAPALKIFLNAFGSFQMSQEIDYSSTTLQAAIDFISNFQQ